MKIEFERTVELSNRKLRRRAALTVDLHEWSQGRIFEALPTIADHLLGRGAFGTRGGSDDPIEGEPPTGDAAKT